MAKRIADIAEEFGVSTEDIIRKCVDEGIPPTIVKDGMSTVSAKLAATIHKWLSEPPDEQGEYATPKK